MRGFVTTGKNIPKIEVGRYLSNRQLDGLLVRTSDKHARFMPVHSEKLTKYASRCIVSPGSSREIERFRSVLISVLRVVSSALPATFCT